MADGIGQNVVPTVNHMLQGRPRPDAGAGSELISRVMLEQSESGMAMMPKSGCWFSQNVLLHQ